MDAPLVDRRTRKDIVDETEALAETHSNWKARRATDDQTDTGPDAAGPDAGQALIGIFGRFAEIIIERINRAPEKNLLAFLNLIGTEPLPPRPARVPLTFRLASNSPVDAALPAGTQTAAAPLDGEEDEVIFETERDMVVTRAQLQAVYVRDTETDCYSDRTQQTAEESADAFAVFEGDQPVPHELYIACEDLLTQTGIKNVTLILNSPDTWQWETWPIEWSYWDGTGWQPKIPDGVTVSDGVVRVYLNGLPKFETHTVNGTSAAWLRASLQLPLLPAKNNVIPESIAIEDSPPQDLIQPFAPFGSTASAKFFYLSADDAFRAGGAVATLKIRFSRPGTRKGRTQLKLKWSYLARIVNATEHWEELDPRWFSFIDTTNGFTKDGEVRFRIPVDWQHTVHSTRSGRWLHVEIVKGQYSRRPQIESLTVSYDWVLPRVSAIAFLEQTGPDPLRPDLTFFNSAAIDLGKDFYPFGEHPRFNDAFYLACDEAFAQSRGTVMLDLKLTRPGITKGSPRIAWEIWTGYEWRVMRTSTVWPGADSFTRDGYVTLSLPRTIAPTSINGIEKYWLRARLVKGNYGEAASVKTVPNKAGSTTVTAKDGKTNTETTYTITANYDAYEQVAATYSAPLVASIKFARNAHENTIPVSACLTNNDQEYIDHLSAVSSTGTEPFSIFTVTEDTRPALYLGLDQPSGPRPVTLYLGVKPPLPEQVAADRLADFNTDVPAQLVWEYAGPEGWTSLGTLDQTQALARRDLVHFFGPDDFANRRLFGQSLYWLRVRWHGGSFPWQPKLYRVSLNTTWASQLTTRRQEFIGSSNGNAAQSFTTAQAPVLPGQQLQVRESELPTPEQQQDLQQIEEPDAVSVTYDAAGQPDAIWVTWQAVSDFYTSGPADRHYVIDAMSGALRFGDGQHGRVPPVGQNNIRLTYANGGGAHGNRAADTIVQLKSSVPYVDSVINSEAASGGAEQESLARIKERGPRLLRHRDRTVTAQDLEDLALEADADVTRVKAVVPDFRPTNLWLEPDAKTAVPGEHSDVVAGRIGVIVVPGDTAMRPAPTLSLLRRVKAHLLERCPATTSLWVAGPEWVKVTVSATVVPESLSQADSVMARVTSMLDRFIHPLSGGSSGQGWTFGRVPQRSDLYAVIERITGVDHVQTLALTCAADAGDATVKIELDHRLNQSQADLASNTTSPEVQRWLDRSLVYSGRHAIRVVLEHA